MRVLRCFFIAASLALLPAAAAAQQRDPAPTATANAASAPLPELPHLPPITHPEPDPAAKKELDGLLARITSEDARARTDARAAINDVTAPIVPAIRQRVQDLRASLDREAAPRVLEAARKAGRKSLKGDAKPTKDGEAKPAKEAKEKETKKKKRKDDDADEGDWLDFLLANARPRDKDWQDVVRLTAMERMLTAVGTTPAVRELIQLHAYFGEMLRIDLQRQIAKLRDKAVPALLEARQHDAKIVQRWANKQLDVLGRAIPGETVSSNDTQILADVLRAYGRTRDVDAARVVLSFCNSERVQLREASREAIAAIGEPGLWQLRDQYLGLTGVKPPRDWGWDRIARELFALYDRSRLAEVHKLMDDGLAAVSSGKLGDAVDAFDKVLARAPLYERRREMVPAYADQARKLGDGKRDEALAMMRKALRLDPKGDRSKKIEAEIAYLEGALSVDHGSPDKTAFQRAIDLDPTHERARAALARLEDKAIERQSHLGRYAAAGGVGLLALLAMILLARRKPNAGTPGTGTPSAGNPSTPPAEAKS